MKTSDLEFEYNERSDGYIYVNEDRLEEEIKGILFSGKDVETLKIPEEISREAYLCLTGKRKNILNWYKFKENAAVLEIGAGYGELTEYLCSKVGRVICYERKRERIDIIKMRCRSYDNLECCSGYLQNMEWKEQFDYIVLHDIFALARKFFKGEDPNVDMIEFLIPYLKPSGRILLIVENRLGLKYFAGAAEEISNQFFWGINSYDEDERCRTFSKSELENILKNSGIRQINWYYPYPNLVYPLEIYTDEIFEKIVYGISRPDYEMVADRFQLFDEQRMFWTLHREGVENRFVNAFFVECSMKPIEKQVFFADIINDFKVISRIKDEFVDEKGTVLPKGIRVDAYLAFMTQKVVDCNLGKQNPYISKIHFIFSEICQYLQKGSYNMQDFYFWNGELRAYTNEEKERQPSSEYQRWELVYEWYMNHIMFYRNAKRRILLEDLMQIMNISIDHIEGYIRKWKDQKDAYYLMPRLSQNMFDFEAEDAKSRLCFEKEALDTRSLKNKLDMMWKIGG